MEKYWESTAKKPIKQQEDINNLPGKYQDCTGKVLDKYWEKFIGEVPTNYHESNMNVQGENGEGIGKESTRKVVPEQYREGTQKYW